MHAASRIAFLLVLLTAVGCGGAAPVASATTPVELVAETSAPVADTAPSLWGETLVPLRQHVEVRVMTFNIRNGRSQDGVNAWEHRAPLVVEVLRTQRPALVALQEAHLFQVEQLLEALPEYAALGVGRDDGVERGEQVAILFEAARFEVLDRGAFWLSETPGTPGSRGWGADYARMCTWAALRERASGKELMLYDTHLDHRVAEARRQGLSLILRHIEEHAQGRAVMVAGDLNLPPSDDALTTFLERSGLVDAYRVAHPEVAPDEATHHGFHGTTRGERIDFLLTSPSLAVREAAIVRDGAQGELYPSDHYPLVFTLRVRGGHTLPRAGAQ